MYNHLISEQSANDKIAIAQYPSKKIHPFPKTQKENTSYIRVVYVAFKPDTQSCKLLHTSAIYSITYMHTYHITYRRQNFSTPYAQ